jgi:hypothetical protein
VLLALPFRYRHEINCAREVMPGPSRDTLAKGLLITGWSVNGASASTAVPIRSGVSARNWAGWASTACVCNPVCDRWCLIGILLVTQKGEGGPSLPKRCPGSGSVRHMPVRVREAVVGWL